MNDNMEDTNFERLMEAIHFCFDILPFMNHSLLDVITLNRILWEADTRQFINTRKSITNESYVKTLSGPIANRTNLALRELEERNDLLFSTPDQWFPITNITHYVPSLLENSELDLIEASMHRILNGSIDQKDELWRLASEGENLPLFISLAKLADVSEEQMEWARQQEAT